MNADTPAVGYPPAEKPVYRTCAPKVIGVVGGVASGKSAVAKALATALDAVLIDGDAVGHHVLRQADIAVSVRSTFSKLSGSGGEEIDRRELGRIVFSDPAAMDRLESIMHPRMRQLFVATIEGATADGRAVIFDAAVLLESGWDDLCDVVLFVDVPAEVRLQRARLRGWDEARWRKAEASQWPVEQKRAAADVVVANVTTPEEAAAEALVAVERMKSGEMEPQQP